jgi:hypothetical protein
VTSINFFRRDFCRLSYTPLAENGAHGSRFRSPLPRYLPSNFDHLLIYRIVHRPLSYFTPPSEHIPGAVTRDYIFTRPAIARSRERTTDALRLAGECRQAKKPLSPAGEYLM